MPSDFDGGVGLDAGAPDAGPVDGGLPVAPIANNDAFSGVSGQNLVVSSSRGVLRNDTDGNGESLTAALVVPPAGGILTLNPNGSFTFEPPQGFNGTVSFTYKANDGMFDSNLARAFLTISTPPLARSDAYMVETSSLTVPAYDGVLHNDSDPEGRALTALFNTPPNVGTLQLGTNGGFTFTGPSLFAGIAWFTYRADDGVEQSDIATVALVASTLSKGLPIGRASLGAASAQVAGASKSPSISADGRFVAFDSVASDLVANDNNGASDIFVRDQGTGQTTRVSVGAGGAESMGESTGAAISADGRYVAFESAAPNLVVGDSNAKLDVFVHDRQLAITERVSVSDQSTQGDGDSYAPAISADGRYVAFESLASNLVAGDTGGHRDVFVRDRIARTTVRVSVGTQGAGNDESRHASISADGLSVAFASLASNLVPDDGNSQFDVFVRDLRNGTTTRVSVSSAGAQGNLSSRSPAISATGRFVAFLSSASNLVSGDNNGKDDVFVHDRETGSTERVSVTSDGVEATAPCAVGLVSADVSISADGRRVAFVSCANNLVAGDSNAVADVFLHDRHSRQTVRLSVSAGGAQADARVSESKLSANGEYVTFSTTATTLIGGDTNSASDVFVAPVPATLRPLTRVPLSSQGVQSNGDSLEGSPSGDGSLVAFVSAATNLVAGDTNDSDDIFVRDLLTGTTTRVSVSTAGGEANGPSAEPTISHDGRYVVFFSLASNLVPGDNNAKRDVFVHDRLRRETTRVSVASDGTQSNGDSEAPSISADGRYIAFRSDATNLVPDDTNGNNDAFVHDRITGTTTRVSLTHDGKQVLSGFFEPAIALDGRHLVITTGAAQMIATDVNPYTDVFVVDWLAGLNYGINVDAGGTPIAGGAGQAAVSGDGRFVVFSTSVSTLVEDDTNEVGDVFVRDRMSQGFERMSVSELRLEGDDASSLPSISANGRFVLFRSAATNLVGDDATLQDDFFVRDRIANKIEVVSLSHDGEKPDAPPAFVQSRLSADGRYVTFGSPATNLVPGDTNGVTDLFVAPNPLAR